MEVITNNTPDWFWNSESFTLNKKLPDTSVFPTFTIPSNKISASMLRQDVEIGQISGGKHPLERVGHNMFYTNFAGLTNYPNSKLVKFTDLGYSGTNPTDETFWSMSHNSEKIQWLNGEVPIGYDGRGVMGNPSKANKLRQIIGGAINANPGIKICIYSWLDITGGAAWYETKVNELMGLYNNPSTVYSAQIDAGCNAVLDSIYATNDRLYDLTALYIFKKQLLKRKYGDSIPLYSLMWTENEMVDNFPSLHTMRRKRQDEVFIDLVGAKPNALIEYMYNVALCSVTVGDGILGWEGTMPNLSSEKPEYETQDWDVGGGIIQTQVGNETWSITNARVWKSCMLFWNLALYHASQHKDTIEETNFDWITPDFEYKGNLRTGDFKHIPYNKLYEEPVVQLKYNNNKTKASLLVMDCWGDNTPKTIRIIDGNIDVTVIVNGRKAELYKINL